MAFEYSDMEAFCDVLTGDIDGARRALAILPEHRLTSLADAARDLMELAEEVRDRGDG